MGLQGAHEHGREPEVGHAMALHERPDAVGAGMIGGTIVEYHGGAGEQGAEYEPRPHHPAHVGHPVHDFTGLQVHGLNHVLRGFDRESAVGMHGTLGETGRSARIDQHERVFGRGIAGLGIRRQPRHEVVPPSVPAGRHGGGGVAGDPNHPDIADAGGQQEGRVSHGFNRYGMSSSVKAVGRHEQSGSCILKAGRHRVRTVARK